MKIRPLEVDLFHADERTDRHDDAKQFFFHNFAKAPKKRTRTFSFLFFSFLFFYSVCVTSRNTSKIAESSGEKYVLIEND